VSTTTLHLSTIAPLDQTDHHGLLLRDNVVKTTLTSVLTPRDVSILLPRGFGQPILPQSRAGQSRGGCTVGRHQPQIVELADALGEIRCEPRISLSASIWRVPALLNPALPTLMTTLTFRSGSSLIVNVALCSVWFVHQIDLGGVVVPPQLTRE
jgi:hypothetical protein